MRISCRRQGMGFDTGDAGRMLERFARAINAEAARIPGMGVGLYVVKEIVTKHHGPRVAGEPAATRAPARTSGSRRRAALRRTRPAGDGPDQA